MTTVLRKWASLFLGLVILLGAIGWITSSRSDEDFSIAPHSGSGVCFAFVPNRLLLATGGDDCVVKLWDLQKREIITTFAGLDAPVRAIAFTRDGKRLAAVSAFGKIIAWNAETAEQVAILNANYNGLGVLSFLGDSNQVIVANDRLWDLSSKSPRLVYPFGGVSGRDMALSPDGTTIATAIQGDSSPKIWDAKTGERLFQFEVPKGELPVAFWCATYSHDGKQIATGSMEGKLQLWDTKTRLMRVGVGTGTNRMMSVQFSPDGAMVASTGASTGAIGAIGATYGKVKLWDSRSGRELGSVGGSFASYSALDFSHDGSVLAAACGDGTVKIWNVRRLLDK